MLQICGAAFVIVWRGNKFGLAAPGLGRARRRKRKFRREAVIIVIEEGLKYVRREWYEGSPSMVSSLGKMKILLMNV